MALVNCVCARPIGASECKTQTGIAELYYTPVKNITAIVFEPTTDTTCCTEGSIASFGLIAAAPSGLLQPITFVKQDDDTGALFEHEDLVDGGNVVRNYSFVFQANTDNPDDECTLDSMINQEVAFLYKTKSGKWKFVNWSGGLRVTSVAGNSNQSYKVVTLSGRANDRALYVSYEDDGVWADANLIPVSVDVDGLINA